MEKLTYMDNKDEAAYKNFAGQTFGYNSGVPGNIKKITEGEFWSEIEHRHPTHVSSAQIHDDDFKNRMIAAGRPESMHQYYVGCTLFFFDDFVLLVELDRKHHQEINACYYKIAICFHEYVEEFCTGMFEHHLRCTKCPSTKVIDSSD